MASAADRIKQFFKTGVSNAIEAARGVVNKDLSPAAGTQSIADLTSKIASGGWKQMTPFTATSFQGQELPKPVTDFSTQFFAQVPRTYSFGQINPMPEPTSFSGKAGKALGSIVSAAPLYTMGSTLLGAVPKIAALPRVARAGVDLLAGTGISAATMPGTAKERASAIKGMMTDPTNLALSMAFPIAGVQAINKEGIKSSKFIKPYLRGDITKLEKTLDTILGTESFIMGGRKSKAWKQKLPARESALKNLEAAAEAGDETAQKYLPEVYNLMGELENARAAMGEVGKLTGKVKQAVKPVVAPIKEAVEKVPTISRDIIRGEKIIRVRSDAPRKLMEKLVKESKKTGARIELTPGVPAVPTQTGLKLTAGNNKILALPEGELPRKPKPGDFMGIANRFIGEKQAGKTISNKIASQFTDVPVEKGKEFIDHVEGVAKSNDPFILQKAREWEAVNNNIYYDMQKLAKRTKQDLGYIKGYVTHIWEQTPEEVTAAAQALGKKLGNANKRTIDTYEEGIKAGLTPFSTNPAEILQRYVDNMKQVESGVNFYDDLKASGVLANKRQSGWEPVLIPGISSSNAMFYAPKAIAEKITNMFRGESIFSGLAEISKRHQDISMSGGIPFTPVNAWTMGQMIKDITSFSPYRTVRTASNFVRSNFPGVSRKYFLDNVDDLVDLQTRTGIASPEMDVSRMIDKGFIKNTFGSSIGDAWSSAVSDATFRRFYPMQLLEEYKNVKNQAIKQGVPLEEAKDVAADAVKNWFGLTDAGVDATRSKEVKDLMNTFLFAPRFRESMINFWINNVKAVSPLGVKNGKVVFNNPLSLQNKANTMFIAGTIGSYFAYNALNKKFTGHTMNENPPGMEDKLLIPQKDGSYIGIPFLSSIATIPRLLYRAGLRLKEGNVNGLMTELKGVLSTTARPVADIATNQNYFGNKIYDPESPEQPQQIAKYVGQSLVAHPYLKEFGASIPKVGEYVGDKRNIGDPAWQRLTRASEAPVRFYDKKTVDGKWFFDARDKALKGMDKNTRDEYLKLHPQKETWEMTTSTPDNVSVKEQMEKNMIRANNPELYMYEKQIATATNQKTGQPIDPIYVVPMETAMRYYRYQSLPPGSKDKSDLIKAYPDISQLMKLRSQFFAENPLPKSGTTSPYDNKPVASEYVQTQMDLKNWDDPQVRAFLDANQQWQDEQRMLMGLLPKDGGGFGSGKKKPKKVGLIQGKRINPKKIKIKSIVPKKFKLQNAKIKPLKISKNKTKAKVKK